MIGKGSSHGSITVINAMPCGIGATIGVDLNTTATFEETDGRRSVTILNDASEDKNLARVCVSRAYEHAGMEESDGWNLVTDSEIPVSRGLKSSSCACNAILRAVFPSQNTTSALPSRQTRESSSASVTGTMARSPDSHAVSGATTL